MQQSHYVGKGFGWFVLYLALIAALCVGLMLYGPEAKAQSAPTLTFTAENTRGAESVVPRLTWSTQPAATSCAASGASNWTGSKAASGTVTLPAIASSATYVLSCTWAGGKATLNWTAPTQNTNGSAFTNPAAAIVHYGRAADALAQSVRIAQPSPPLSTFVVEPLAAGAWFFSIQIESSAGVMSVLSNVATKTVIDESANRTISIVVDPRPNPATDLTAN